MTHEQYWELYDNGEISVKIWDGIVNEVHKTVEAFEYGDKFFLRIHNAFSYVTGVRKYGKRYRMSKESHVIKEFGNRESANAYFKKVAEGLKRVPDSVIPKGAKA